MKIVRVEISNNARRLKGFKAWSQLLLILLLLAGSNLCRAHILHLTDGNLTTFPEMIEDLRRSRVILIGESHDNQYHHQAQLQIIEALAESGARVTLGLEMFRSESQPYLDRWVAGDLDYLQFMQVYHDNWKGSVEYNEIFMQARKNKWPMLGLNLSRQIVNQVASRGGSSLSGEQLGRLPVVQCLVDETYMDFIRRALRGHEQEGEDFVNFCEAQMLWDTVMAKNLRSYLDAHPESTMVVLTGYGHAWKHAIPAQLGKMGVSGWRVILPQVPGRIDLGSVSASDADYLLLGVKEGLLH